MYIIFDRTISTKKTEVLHQPASRKPYSEPTIIMNGQKLQVVDKLTCLGSTLSRTVHIDDGITARATRTAKGRLAFDRLCTNAWKRYGFRLNTKPNVYKAVVLPTFLYTFETWKSTKVMPRNITCPLKLPERTLKNR